MFEALSAGLFNGLIYAAVAVGLALIWGITDVINFAHGEFLMLGMYAAYWLFTLGHIDPTMSAPLVAIALAFVGFMTYALIIRRLQKAGHGHHPGHLRPGPGAAPAGLHRLQP